MQEHRHGVAHVHTVGGVGGTDALAATAVAVVADDGDGEVHLGGMCPET